MGDLASILGFLDTYTHQQAFLLTKWGLGSHVQLLFMFQARLNYRQGKVFFIISSPIYLLSEFLDNNYFCFVTVFYIIFNDHVLLQDILYLYTMVYQLVSVEKLTL